MNVDESSKVRFYLLNAQSTKSSFITLVTKIFYFFEISKNLSFTSDTTQVDVFVCHEIGGLLILKEKIKIEIESAKS
jgi:hypothetical protein